MAIHRFILHNGEIRENTAALLSAGQVGLLSGWGVFSTLRVMDGQLFAWERHWARMVRDARLMHVPMPLDAGPVQAAFLRLAEANGAPDCTLRAVVVRNGGGLWEGPSSGQASDVIGLTADLKKWGESVTLGIEPNARYAANEFCRAKILSWSQNLTWAERAIERGWDEVVLLNEHGRVAECTSANVFAVFGDRVVTPALSEGCLPGITREILLEIGGRISEGTLTVDDLYLADEVFITSSTRGLLRVREIGGRALASRGTAGGPMQAQLTRKFKDFLKQDIAQRKHTALI